MPELPSLVVVTPSFRQGAFIERTLASVASQSHTQFQHLVMDGGSQDETPAILARAAANDSRLRWWSEPDRGQAHAVNKAIALGAGEIVGWLNSDDVYFPKAFATVLSAFAADSDLAAVYGEAYHLDAEDRQLDRYPVRAWNESNLQRGCCLCQPAVFFRRSAWDKLGGLDESLHFCMDYDFWIRMLRAGYKVGRMPNVLAGSRLHDSAKTVEKRLVAHAEQNAMTRKHWPETPPALLLDYACVELGVDRFGVGEWRRLGSLYSRFRAASQKWNEPSPAAVDVCRFSTALVQKGVRKLARAA